jgi:hypothetical protein
MSYDRKIKYLDYLENGDKIRNAGFVKIEMVDGVCNMQFSISGLLPTDTIQREVWITDGAKETELGNLQLDQGKGVLSLKGLSSSGLGKERIPYENLYEIYIPITKNREVRCRWGDRKRMPRHSDNEQRSREMRQDVPGKISPWSERSEEDTPKKVNPVSAKSKSEKQEIDKPETVRPGSVSQETTGPDNKSVVHNRVTYKDKGDGQESPVIGGRQSKAVKPNEFEQEAKHVKTLGTMDGNPTLETVRGGNRDFMWPQNATLSKKETKSAPVLSGEKAMPVRIQEDKWKQLCALYPHVAPFQDDRDFLSIGPNDFVILNRKYHKLVNNSFLLHGFYNYEHLILFRRVKRGTELFYMGVPGNYYEKEKQVALMYGFESFECKKEPAQEGDFGYYLIPVDL